MRSRDLPSSRTQEFALPRDVIRSDGEGYVAFDAPACREASFCHRLVLDDPPEPEHVPMWLDTWRSHHAGKGIDRACLSWEKRKPDTFAGAQRLRCLMMDEEVAPEVIPQVRAIVDIDEALVLMTEEHNPTEARNRHNRWNLTGILDRCADDWGRFLGWYENDELVGMSAILWNHREARLQSIAVREDHRRKGICSMLVSQCIADYQAESFGITYAVAAEDSHAEAALRKLRFRHVTYDFSLALEP